MLHENQNKWIFQKWNSAVALGSCVTQIRELAINSSRWHHLTSFSNLLCHVFPQLVYFTLKFAFKYRRISSLDALSVPNTCTTLRTHSWSLGMFKNCPNIKYIALQDYPTAQAHVFDEHFLSKFSATIWTLEFCSNHRTFNDVLDSVVQIVQQFTELDVLRRLFHSDQGYKQKWWKQESILFRPTLLAPNSSQIKLILYFGSFPFVPPPPPVHFAPPAAPPPPSYRARIIIW